MVIYSESDKAHRDSQQRKYGSERATIWIKTRTDNNWNQLLTDSRNWKSKL